DSSASVGHGRVQEGAPLCGGEVQGAQLTVLGVPDRREARGIGDLYAVAVAPAVGRLAEYQVRVHVDNPSAISVISARESGLFNAAFLKCSNDLRYIVTSFVSSMKMSAVGPSRYAVDKPASGTSISVKAAISIRSL